MLDSPIASARSPSHRRSPRGALPVIALAALSTAVLETAGRVFTHAQLARSTPGLVIRLTVATAKGGGGVGGPPGGCRCGRTSEVTAPAISAEMATRCGPT